LYGGSAATIFAEPSTLGHDPAAWFASLVRRAAADPLSARLARVTGHVEAILASIHPTTYQPTSVDFVHKGVTIPVTRTTYGTAAPMRIADNMAAQPVGA